MDAVSRMAAEARYYRTGKLLPGFLVAASDAARLSQRGNPRAGAKVLDKARAEVIHALIKRYGASRFLMHAHQVMAVLNGAARREMEPTLFDGGER